ncbi:hypothetical protein [Streptomyces sp. NBC_00203]|uniref:hypothetical protein n=1 Tax=Streptomyces sp. NBC_00203 TaxID=2975680 RepID=UPI003249E467
MPVLPAGRIASSALCAALLVGITGTAAVAADSARERSHTASPDARLPGADALLAQVRKLNILGGELTPVTDLLNAVLKADNGQLPAAEARKLGDAAKGALAKAATKAPATGVLRPAPARRAADPTSDALDALEDALAAVEEAVDSLLEAITSGDDSEVLSLVDDGLTEVDDLITELLDSDLPEPTRSDPATLPSTSTSTSVSPVSAVTLPATTLRTTVLLPTS